MGDVFDTIASAVGVASSVATNPYVPEIMCRVKQVSADKSGQAVPVCLETPAGIPDNLGLSKFMGPIRFYAYAEQHPWAYPAIAALILGVPFLLGYAVGKNK